MFLLIFGEHQLTEQQEVFTTTILHALANTLGNLQTLALQEQSLFTVPRYVVRCMEAPTQYNQLGFTFSASFATHSGLGIVLVRLSVGRYRIHANKSDLNLLR